MADKPEFIYNTSGDWMATIVGSYIFDSRGEYIGFVENRATYTRDGEWIGDVSKDGRILRKRSGKSKPLHEHPLAKPATKPSNLPARAPLPPQTGDIGYDLIDVLEEDPEVFKRLSDRRADLD
ncbi:MAG: 4-fold beta flower protein [Chloroflexota bacterium]